MLQNLRQGIPPLYEPDLAEFTAEQACAGRLAYCDTVEEAVAGAEYVFITIDTPVDDADQSDVRPIYAAVDAIAKYGTGTLQIVISSQVPVGTCENIAGRLHFRAPELSFSVIYHPENLRLGEALKTFLSPDFIVVGAADEASAAHFLQLYDGIPGARVTTNLSSAEFGKHALNTYLASSVSFINELADLAEVAGADIRAVARTLKLDRRVGPYAFLNPGQGFSGGTLARDVQTLRGIGRAKQRKTRVLDAVLEVNADRIPGFVEKIRHRCGTLRGRRLAVLGLTYKPGTDTLRRSNSLRLAALLRKEGAQVRAFDPKITSALPETSGIVVCASAADAVRDADAIILATPWPEFKSLEWRALNAVVSQPLLFDTCNVLNEAAAEDAGFEYIGVGIGNRIKSPREAVQSAI